MTEDNSWPTARFDTALADEARLWVEVVQEVLEGKSLRAIAKERGFPVLRFQGWVVEDATRLAEYERALAVRADELVHEAVELVDGEGEVARDRLRADVRMKVAGKWDRARYGERQEVTISVGISVLGALEEARGRVEGRIVDSEPVDDRADAVLPDQRVKELDQSQDHELI